jgi:hypothetical protein
MPSLNFFLKFAIFELIYHIPGADRGDLGRWNHEFDDFFAFSQQQYRSVTPRLLLKAELLCICAIPWISR